MMAENHSNEHFPFCQRFSTTGTVPYHEWTGKPSIYTEYVYDTENRLTGILHKDASTDAVLDSFAYTLNDVGNITRIDHADNSYWAYGYDTRNRLTSARRYNTLGGLLHWFNYTYDAADNMTQRWRFQMSNSQMDTWNFTYNSANEQVSMTLNGGTPETFTYDALGRLTTRTQGSYSASYGYRYNSRLYQATSNFPGETNVTLDYGGDGKLRTRITADETRRYRYAMGYNAIHEEHDDGGGILATNVFEPGASNGPRLAQMMFGTLTGSLPVYAWHDHLGTVRQWRFANKNSARAIEYDPYGNIYGQSGFVNMPRIYALHEFDSALKQYRAPFRHYRPTMARWITPDPLGMVDGPNRYAYVGGNPVLYIDPDGAFSLNIAGGIVGCIIGGVVGYLTPRGPANNEHTARGAVCGCLGGAISGLGVGLLGGIFTAAIGAFAQCVCNGEESVKCCGKSAFAGGALGGLSGWLFPVIGGIPMFDDFLLTIGLSTGGTVGGAVAEFCCE